MGNSSRRRAARRATGKHWWLLSKEIRSALLPFVGGLLVACIGAVVAWRNGNDTPSKQLAVVVELMKLDLEPPLKAKAATTAGVILDTMEGAARDAALRELLREYTELSRCENVALAHDDGAATRVSVSSTSESRDDVDQAPQQALESDIAAAPIEREGARDGGDARGGGRREVIAQGDEGHAKGGPHEPLGGDASSAAERDAERADEPAQRRDERWTDARGTVRSVRSSLHAAETLEQRDARHAYDVLHGKAMHPEASEQATRDAGTARAESSNDDARRLR